MSALVRWLGRVEYAPVWRGMQDFTDTRDAATPDEIWLLEHAPVFTQGLNGRPEHLLATGDIPVVGIDRGGQVTYHGPGQIVAYPLIDLRRRKLGVTEERLAEYPGIGEPRTIQRWLNRCGLTFKDLLKLPS